MSLRNRIGYIVHIDGTPTYWSALKQSLVNCPYNVYDSTLYWTWAEAKAAIKTTKSKYPKRKYSIVPYGPREMVRSKK